MIEGFVKGANNDFSHFDFIVRDWKAEGKAVLDSGSYEGEGIL